VRSDAICGGGAPSKADGMSAVEVYTTPFCPYCISAKKLLRSKGVEFTEIDVASVPARRTEMTTRANGRTTVPQIFVGSVHVGGCDELYELDEAGRLDALLAR
jgi:glutaredoxin 3